jgi:hypothetical protein
MIRMNALRITSTSLTLILLLVPNSSGIQEAPTGRRGMSFASVAEIEGRAVLVEGKLGPSSFFENLRSIELNDRNVVTNDEGEVQEFPYRIMVVEPPGSTRVEEPTLLCNQVTLGGPGGELR